MPRFHAAPLVVLLASCGLAAGAPAVKPPAGDSEVHVVAIHEGVTKTNGVIHGPKAAVKVDRAGKDVTLVLSSYNPVTWEVTVDPKTKVKKVILGGYHQQAVTGLSKDVEVVEAFHEGREGKDCLYVYYRMESARFRQGIQALHKLTGQDVNSFRSIYRFDPTTPLVVDGLQKEPRLSVDYPRPSPVGELPKLSFQALRFTSQGYDVSATYGDFTHTGSDLKSLKPLPERIIRVAYDPVGKKYYGTDHHDAFEVDLDKQAATKMNPGLAVPKLQSTRAITFDTKRNRLLVVTSRYMFSYEPAKGRWSVVAETPRGLMVAAVAYHAKDDLLYVLGGSFGGEDGGMPVLYRLNAQGAEVKKTELGPPMFPGLVSHMGLGSAAQIVSAGDHLVVLAKTPSRDSGSSRPIKSESFMYIVDPRTETVQLATKEKE